MDIPLPIHVDSQGDMETLPPKDSHLVMQARSLRNTLSIVKTKLRNLENSEIHTFEDIEHYKVGFFNLIVFIVIYRRLLFLFFLRAT
jgi:hypothetical protein